MRHCLPLLFAALVAAMPTEVHGQYFYFDTNGDQACGPFGDCYAGEQVQIDVWLDTNHDEYGTERTCAGGEPLSLISYELVFQKWASAVSGTAVFGAWTNAVPGYSEVGARVESVDYLRVGFTGA